MDLQLFFVLLKFVVHFNKFSVDALVPRQFPDHRQALLAQSHARVALVYQKDSDLPFVKAGSSLSNFFHLWRLNLVKLIVGLTQAKVSVKTAHDGVVTNQLLVFLL